MTDAVPPVSEQRLEAIIRQHAVPRDVLPTGVAPLLRRLPGIRAVLFDVYGTLLISGSGDVGTTNIDARPRAFLEAFAAVELPYKDDAESGVRLLAETIAAHHQRRREKGITDPEVDIREVWHDVIAQLVNAGTLPPHAAVRRSDETSVLALEYEMRTNPTWPMPNSLACLHRLRERGLLLGIVSNAQFSTRLVLPMLLGESLHALGFCAECTFWSYESRQAKPGLFLFERGREAVEANGIRTDEVLYIGNDMLNDIWPARRVGFRTALFAGDARSYRPREDEPRVAGVTPDLIITDLGQLPDCLRDER
jgi:putative hydrolase of the HAD superfamily